MCGIAGSINVKLDIPRLTKDLWHRGPDEQTTFDEKNLCLHHHRLAIVDIACGHQPMHHEHLTIIFNGEIYNHLAVRKSLQLDCTTNSDTETIIRAYAKVGAGCLNEFDGMFALAIYDRRKEELFLARDRAGKKPIYYYYDGKKFVFASELQALHKQLGFSIDENNIRQYVRSGFLFGAATPYKDVYELPAASFATISTTTAQLKMEKWWDMQSIYQQKNTDSLDTAISKVDEILHEAVRNRVETSDLEVGSFLSGGIDSGIVTAIASKYNSSLKTFTVSFEGQFDEAPLAKLVADKYGTTHHEIKISFNQLQDDTEKILANYGEPHSDDSAIPSYYVSREARRHLTVILNGDGGDEVFGGYRRYVPFSKIDFFSNSALRAGFFKLIHQLTPSSSNKMSKLNYAKRMAFLGSRKGYDTYLAATTDIFEGFEKTALISPWSPAGAAHHTFQNILNSDLSGLQKIMLLDFENILPSLLLVKMDIATMAHSLEGRSPLLSKGVLGYLPTLADEYKIKGTTTKYLLRKLAERYLPAQLVNQPKRGFEPPLQRWVNNELRNMIGDYINQSGSLYPTFINQSFILDVFNNRISIPPEKRAKMLWLVFSLEVWYRKVYLSKSSIA